MFGPEQTGPATPAGGCAWVRCPAGQRRRTRSNWVTFALDRRDVPHLHQATLGDHGAPTGVRPRPTPVPASRAVVQRAAGRSVNRHELVCAGAVPLTEAQQAIAADWSAANARYGSMPVPAPSAAQTSAPAAPAPAPPSVSSAPAQPVETPAQPAPQRSTAPSTGGTVVHPGAFCKPAGATGATVHGTPMVCGPASDGRNRWHSR